MERGAEALVTETEWDGQPAVRKERNRKGYRTSELDERLRGERTKGEENLLIRARRAGVRVPTVWERQDSVLILERLSGKKVKDVFDTRDRNRVAGQIGRAAAKLHRSGIVHGDLTPANMIWLPVSSSRVSRPPEPKTGNRKQQFELALIDFGLGFSSTSPEDHATDLYVLKEALSAGHAKLAKTIWSRILKAYRQDGNQAVLKRLDQIERRRRYRGE